MNSEESHLVSSAETRIGSTLASPLNGPSSQTERTPNMTLRDNPSWLIDLLPEDITQTPTATTFHSILTKNLEYCKVNNPLTITGKKRRHADIDRMPEEEPNDEEPHAETSDESSGTVVTSALFQGILSVESVRLLADRCVALLATDPEYADPLRILLRSNALSAQRLSSLIPLLCEQRNMDLLEQCILHLHDITEDELVSILIFALNQRQDFTLDQQIAIGSVPIDPIDVTIDLVISHARSNTFLRSSLVKLSPVHVRRFFEYAHSWLCLYALLSPNSLRTLVGKRRIPTLAAIVDWVASLCDAQWSSLTLLPQSFVYSLLERMHNTLSVFFTPTDSMLTIVNGMLTQFVRTQRKLEETSIGESSNPLVTIPPQYSIEFATW
jgi:hypothetical protein